MVQSTGPAGGDDATAGGDFGPAEVAGQGNARGLDGAVAAHASTSKVVSRTSLPAGNDWKGTLAIGGIERRERQHGDTIPDGEIATGIERNTIF